jgi:DNA-directed RNA polymerase specialized sigma24 family protein
MLRRGDYHWGLPIAKRKLDSAPRRAADEEDAVQSAFDSFFRAVEKNRFSHLNDRTDLWKLLVTLTERKASNQRRKELAQKRGSGKVIAATALPDASASASDLPPLDAAVDLEPTPDCAVEFAEQVQILLSKLNKNLLPVALAKLEYCTNQEIADRLNLSLRTVERRLELIRRVWQESPDE